MATWSYTSHEMLMLHGHTQAVSCSQLHGHTQAANSWSNTEKFNTFLASEQHENSFGQYISLQFLCTYYTMMEETLELRIDVSLDQDKDENKEIIYSQNSDVDVVNLESDCPPASSSSSSDGDGGNISGPEHVELVSPTTPPMVFRSASKRFTSLSFAERCYHIMNYLCSPESDRVYPFFITHKWDRKNFRKRTDSFRWDERRQKLFHFYKYQFGLGSYKSSLN